ncbi:MAG: SDR family NAD(P)-dependent oxidoreductase [Erysipelotrichaceae bacterium]|nr:SDR family NAD(P)-dependent oxidoreductase [Erysipelotrichaceae bacterium]
MKKIAVITGASSGIGKQFFLQLPEKEKYDEIWVIARGKDALEKLREETDRPLKVLPMDLSDQKSFKIYTDALEAEKPVIGLLVNASGFGIFDSVEMTRMEDAEGMVDLNCKALMKMTMLSLQYMASGSKVIEIASMAAFQPIPYIDIYGATKAFVLSFSRALNQEVKSKGIQVMAVCPYWTKTKFFDRAVAAGREGVVKKYVVMYDPVDIVKRAYSDLAKGKDKSIYGFIAQGQALLCKLLPHKLVMHIWMKQQGLK